MIRTSFLKPIFTKNLSFCEMKGEMREFRMLT